MSLPLDLETVRRWVDGRLPGFDGALEALPCAGGQSNPTYQIRTSAGDYVLRRQPPGKLLKSAHAVDREFRVQKVLAETEVPVPAMHLFCEDRAVLGSQFYLMSHVAGQGFHDPCLPDLGKSARATVIGDMNRVLAAIHDVDLAAVGLTDYGPDGDYFARQLARWSSQYEASATEVQPDMEVLITWLADNLPHDDGQRCLVHGDFRLDNLLFNEAQRCVAVLDWELSTLGHPYADLAAVIMQWRMPPGRTGRGLAGVDRAALGLPSDEAFIAAYCDRRGIAGIANFGFYLAFSFFRMAAILQGVKKRALDGNAADPQKALRLGAYVPEFASAGLAATRE